MVMLMLIAPACTKEEVRRLGEGILKEMSETRVVALVHGFGSGDDTGMHELLELLEESAPSHITVVAKVFSPFDEDKPLAVAFLKEGVKSAEGNPEKTEIILIGHSMGGYAVVAIAKLLNEADTTVDKMVQIDAMDLRSGSIPVCQPANVSAGLTYFQETNPIFPYGDWCESDDAIDIDVKEHFPESEDLGCWSHTGMDNCPPLHQEVKDFVFAGTIPTGLGISPLP